MLGMGVMIAELAGNADSVGAFAPVIGKEIAVLVLTDSELTIRFTDNSVIDLYDGGQSCCESRYMCTDDDLSHHIGASLMGAEVREAPSLPAEYGYHDTAFLVVKTSKGDFTIVSHNEHNGYYGGFAIRCRTALSA